MRENPLGLFWVVAALASSRDDRDRAKRPGLAPRASTRPRRGAFVSRIARARTIRPLGLAQFVISQAGTVILQIFASSAEVGVYFGCNRIAWIAYLPTELLLAAAMPRFASASSRDQFRRVLIGVQRLSTTWTPAMIAATYAAPAFVAADAGIDRPGRRAFT